MVIVGGGASNVLAPDRKLDEERNTPLSGFLVRILKILMMSPEYREQQEVCADLGPGDSITTCLGTKAIHRPRRVLHAPTSMCRS